MVPKTQVRTSYTTSLVVKRLIPEEDRWTRGFYHAEVSIPGCAAWVSLWEKTELNLNSPLTDAQKVKLEREATEILRTLSADNRVHFCRELTEYVRRYPEYQVFDDVPKIVLAREKFPSELGSLDRKIGFVRDYRGLATAGVGFFSFAAGSSFTGYWADLPRLGIESRPIVYFLVAAGAVVLGGVGVFLSSRGFISAEDYFRKEKGRLGEEMKQDLVSRVQQYLASHS